MSVSTLTSVMYMLIVQPIKYFVNGNINSNPGVMTCGTYFLHSLVFYTLTMNERIPFSSNFYTLYKCLPSNT